VHPKLTLFCIILSHLNSAVNPVLYAYHLKDFRAALKNLLLKMMGVDIDQQAEAIHRFSVASQHRLQSMDSNMRSTQPRLYVGECECALSPWNCGKIPITLVCSARFDCLAIDFVASRELFAFRALYLPHANQIVWQCVLAELRVYIPHKPNQKHHHRKSHRSSNIFHCDP